MTKATRAQVRQTRIARPLPAPPTQQVFSGPAGSQAAPDIVLGKIVAINLMAQDAQVAPIKPGVDPTDAVAWADPENFDVPICAWTQGLSAAAIDNPAVCIRASSDRYWMIYHPNLIGTDYDRFCQPQGLLSPQALASCTEPDSPGICSTTYACCLPDGTCDDLNELDCMAAGGLYFGPESPDQDDGLTCDELAGVGIECDPVGACCQPPFGDGGHCVAATAEGCAEAGGIFHAATLCTEVTCP